MTKILDKQSDYDKMLANQDHLQGYILHNIYVIQKVNVLNSKVLNNYYILLFFYFRKWFAAEWFRKWQWWLKKYSAIKIKSIRCDNLY